MDLLMVLISMWYLIPLVLVAGMLGAKAAFEMVEENAVVMVVGSIQRERDGEVWFMGSDGQIEKWPEEPEPVEVKR